MFSHFRKILYDSDGVPSTTSESNEPNIEVRDDAVYEVSEGARLHFVKFETKHIDKCLDYIAKSMAVGKDENAVKVF